MQVTASAPATSRPVDRRVLLLALALGAIAAGLSVAYLRSQEARPDVGVPTLDVVVAREEIPAGKRITASMVELKPIPEAAVVRGVATSPEQVVGQMARYPLARGEQVSTSRLVVPARTQAISFQIPPGLRGFTIPVSVTRSPAALLVPGDFVDVLATLDPPSLGAPASARGSDEAQSAVTLLQNVQVLAVQRQYVESGLPYDPSVRGTAPRESTISYLTLAVTPEQAQLLTLALERAKLLTVSLRAFGDQEVKELSPFSGPFR